jgi:hypothetical protein
MQIHEQEQMINELTEKYFQPKISNRESARIVDHYVRRTATSILANRSYISKVLKLEWKNGQIEEAPVAYNYRQIQVLDKNIFAKPVYKIKCEALF